MTTLGTSISLWLGGAVVGAAVGGHTGAPKGSGHHGRGAFLGAILGAVLVGSVGDASLESNVPRGRWAAYARSR